VWVTQVGTPITSTDRQDGELGNDDGCADRSCDLFGGLDTETDMAFGVTNDNNGLESSTLTGAGLLLNGLDLWQRVWSVL